jgi:hypothetical protein
MAGIDLTGLTLNPIEVDDIKDFIIERVFEHPALEQIHGGVKSGIKMQQQIVFASQFGKMGLKKAASCDRQTSSAESTLTEKYWNPVGIEDTLIICQAEVDQLFKAYYTKINSYREMYDITGTDLEVFYALMIINAMVLTIWRAAWFADLNVAQAAAGTAGLVLAADVKFYDYIDGLWAQIFDAVTATTVQRVTITENAVTTSKAAQLTLAAGAAKAYFRAVRNAADSRLRSDPNAQMLVSRELFDNYKDGLEDAGAPYKVELTLDGLPRISYDGYNIVNMETIWNLAAREDFVNNTTDNVYDLPHRIVFTVPENIPIGSLNEDDFDELEQWYNIDERKNKTAFGFTEDAKLLEEYMITVAY